MATNTSTMLADSSPLPERSGPLSDGNSSSLSELDDMPDERPDFGSDSEKEEQDGESIKDNDTEAETEHIDPSPAKSRLAAPGEHTDEPDEDEALTSSQIMAPEIEPLSPVANLSEAPADIIDEPMADAPELAVDAPDADESRKRKRSSSLSDIDDASDAGEAPARKRSASKGIAEIEKATAVAEDAKEPADDEGESVPSEAEEAAPEEASSEIPAPLRKSKRNNTQEDDLVAASPGAADEGEGQENDDGDEDDDAAAQAGEQDEAENAARNEEELAKKMVAMDNFKHIEAKWAVFRDKLFDERLRELSAIQEDLEREEPTNPTFLRQRQCLDERRDEKIRVEDRLCHYKTAELERVTLANRSIGHSQFAQEIRDQRDNYLSQLNEEFSRIHRERRQSKTKEPHYVHKFVTKKPQQISNQRAYNKEVSLLSGIAKYKGFPAAPELEGAPSSEIEADLKRMNIKSKATAYSQIASSKHYDEMAGEANFLAKNTWARNPPLPPHIMPDQPPGISASEVATPQRNGAEGVQGSASTIAMESEPPNTRANDDTAFASSPLNEAQQQPSSLPTVGDEKAAAPKNALGIMSASGGELARPSSGVKSGAPSQAHTSRARFPGQQNGQEGGTVEVEEGRQDTQSAAAFPGHDVQNREQPQFGPLASGIVAEQGGRG